jgi:hypothetical protein
VIGVAPPDMTDAGVQLVTSALGSGSAIALLFVWLRGQFAQVRLRVDFLESRINNLEARQDDAA